MRRFIPVAASLAAFLLLPLPARCASPTSRGPAAASALFAAAEKSFAALQANAQAQRRRQNFSAVLDAYRRVFEKFPATRQGEESLMRAGELLTLLFRWTRQEGDLNQAQNYYQRLIQTAPNSPLVDDALLAIAFLYLDHYKDPAQAWLRFRDVTRHAPSGARAAEAKRQLKRLAGYAPSDKSSPAAGPSPAAAPAVASTSPPAVIASQPLTVASAPLPTVVAMPAPAINSMPPLPPATQETPRALNRVRGIRHWSNPEYSRVVIDLDQKANFYSNLLEDREGGGKQSRLYIDLFASLVEEQYRKPIMVNDGILHAIRAGQYTPDSVRLVLEIDGLHTYRVFPMQNPFRIVVDVTGDDTGVASPPAVLPAQTAAYAPEPVPELIPLPSPTPVEIPGSPTVPEPPAAPDSAAARVTYSGAAALAPSAAPPGPAPASARRAVPAPGARSPGVPARTGKPSLARQLGLGVRRVIIDAGHGAHDPGAIGVGGLQEKEVTLDLALRVRDILQAAGYQTVLTRDRDVYLPLEERTALANTARGDLFLSLHCNASDSGKLRGVETYFLNLASNVRSMQTAARENSMAVANMSDLQQIVREIQNSKMDESSQFAARVQRSLHDSLHRKYPDIQNLGVKQAPFYVLIGAQMPSILAEVSFINHRTEGRRLADPAYRQLIAQGLVDGVKRYVKTVKSASLALGQPTR